MAEKIKAQNQQVTQMWASPQPNITREEVKALKELRQDKNLVILKADKRVAMVVPDKEDYIDKPKDLLAQRDSYRPVIAYSTNKHKNKFTNMHRTIKAKWLGDIS